MLRRIFLGAAAHLRSPAYTPSAAMTTKMATRTPLRTVFQNNMHTRTYTPKRLTRLSHFQATHRTFHSTAKQQVRYTRFDARSGAGFAFITNGLYRWSQRPTFYYELGGLGAVCGGLYIANLETVPVSGRRRFNIISNDFMTRMSAQMEQQILQEYRGRVLPERDARVRMTRRVLSRLIPNSGLADDDHTAWDVHVIDDDGVKNAFVIPGGKVFVFTGILPICGGEDGLAAVLGHEIAHNLANHSAERMSQQIFLLAGIFVSSILLGLDDTPARLFAEYAFSRPGSRRQESEADYIGLLMMAQSCYDPEKAAELWARMEKAEEHAPPEFISTHPSSHNRQIKIREWLPEAKDRFEQGGCGYTSTYASQFRSQLGQDSAWYST